VTYPNALLKEIVFDADMYVFPPDPKVAFDCPIRVRFDGAYPLTLLPFRYRAAFD
jgi:hypothetical protein